MLMVPHAAVSDRDWRVLVARRRVSKLLELALAAAKQAQQAQQQAQQQEQQQQQPSASSSHLAHLPSSAEHWHAAWHWSFPTADRAALRVTYELAKRGNGPLQPELWALAFGWVKRGWFAASRSASAVAMDPGFSQHRGSLSPM